MPKTPTCSRCGYDVADLLDTRAAAARLGVTEATLREWRWTKRQEVPWIPMGGRNVRYCQGCIQAWIERRTRTA